MPAPASPPPSHRQAPSLRSAYFLPPEPPPSHPLLDPYMLERVDWLAFFFGYLLLLELGAATPILGGACHAFWPASGLLVAALILRPIARWPLFLGVAAVASLLSSLLLHSADFGLGVATLAASLLEALAAAWLLRKFDPHPFNFNSLRQVFLFPLIAVLAAPALFAVAMEFLELLQGESLDRTRAFLHFSSHAIGVAGVGSAVISLATDLYWTRKQQRRALLLGAIAILLGAAATYFGLAPVRRIGIAEIQLPILAMPVLVASALFVNRPATLLIAFAVVLLAIFYTLPASGRIPTNTAQEVITQTALLAYVLTAVYWPLSIGAIVDEKMRISRECARQFEHLQQVMESSTDCIVLKDPEGRYLIANESAAKLLRTTVDDMVGKTIADFLPPNVALRVDELEQAAKQGRIRETVEEHWTFHGQERVFVVSRSPWPREGKGEKGLVIITRDVTEIRRQKAALQKSELRFQALVDSIPICVFEADPDGACRYVNEVWSYLTGQFPEEAGGFGWVEAVHEQDRASILTAWEEFAQGEVTEFTRELRLRRPDSSVTWVQAHIGALRDEAGRIIGGIGAFIDITPRKYAVENLRESEALFRTLANAAPVMIWRIDSDQQYGFINDRWRDFIGREQTEAEHVDWSDRVHPDDQKRRSEIVAAAFKNRTPYKLDYRILRHDGVYRWIAESGEPIINADGLFEGFIGGCTDITDRHAAQTALQELNQELERRVEQRTADLTAANQQLQREIAVRREILERLEQKQAELAHVSRVTALGEMAAGLAHEIKQPLHAIRNYVSGLKILEQNGSQPALAGMALGEIDRETHRAAAIVDRIRSFATRSTSTHASINLAAIVDDSIALLQSEASRRGARLQRNSLPQGPLQVHGDLIQLQQVLVNLIQNALDAIEGTEREKVVELTVRRDGQNVIIACRDSGPGIASEDVSQIFDPFFTRKPTGLGMGLAISRTIMEAHGGKITVAQTNANGTIMEMSLPLLESAVQTPNAFPAPVAEDATNSATS